ncbi:MAG: cellulose biosynthesis protein BcsG [Deltaproteobacteria bacterium]|nr:cellulose biosynthesis protein BcsG [Deltaproteobacteria bacterium]
MGLWNFYFLAKLYLYSRHFIRFYLLSNILFVLFLLLPVPKERKFSTQMTIAKQGLSVIIALGLLWKESWLPPPLEGFARLSEQGIPTGEYILSFLMRYFINGDMLIIVVILTVSFAVGKGKALTPLTLTLIIMSPLIGVLNAEQKESTSKGLAPGAIIKEVRPLASLEAGEDKSASEKSASSKLNDYITEAKQKNEREIIWEKDPQKYADAFFASESERRINFKKIDPPNEPFDIIFLHICSLSWDDLKEVSLEWKSFFKEFHLVFTDFNTVTSYSGPSILRLLKSTCGQPRHEDVYEESEDSCYLFPNLEKVGFESYFASNHDGKYGNFAAEAKEYGRLGTSLMPSQDLPAGEVMFDGSLIYDDYATLEKWRNLRENSAAKRAALYYNSVTLHEGSTWYPKKEEWWKIDRKVVYSAFLTKLLKELRQFFDKLEASHRNVVIFFVSEHGMALKGAKIQMEGLRDIPLPQITKGPLAIKFIGKGFKEKAIYQRIVSKPVSYMALSSVLASLFEYSPFGPEEYNSDYIINNVIYTAFVAENEGALVIKPDRKHLIFGKEKKWIELPVN